MMADKNLSLVSDIHGGKKGWKTKVKIIRLWKPSFIFAPQVASSIEMVVIDEQGTRIQATVPRSHIGQYDALLHEGGVRVLSSFGVGVNEGSFLMTRHPCKLNFYRHTGVQLCNSWAGPEHSFELRSFHEILATDFDKTYSFDVIGEVIHCQDTKVLNTKGREIRLKCLQLQNEVGINIKCVIWDDLATKLDAFLADPERNDVRVIMLVQFAKLKESDSLNSTTKYFTVNSIVGSKVWINEDFPAFAEFKDRFSTLNVQLPAARILSSSTVCLEDVDYWQRYDLKNIEELMDIKQVTGCVVVATVTKIHTENGWFYCACSKCSNKVVHHNQPVDDNIAYDGIARFVCAKCGALTDVYPKIQVQLRVQDDTGSISLVIFESHVAGYVQKPTSQLISNATKVEDCELFPTEFNLFVGKRFAWKIKVSQYNIENKSDVYIVNKFSDEESVIDAIIKRAASNKNEVFTVAENAITFESNASSSDLKTVVEDNDRDVFFTGSSLQGRAEVHKTKIQKL